MSKTKLSPEPVACGMCGKAVVWGLMFQGKRARQAMTPVGTGRMHVDRKLCKALANITYDDLQSGTFTTNDEEPNVYSTDVSEGPSGRVDNVGESEHADPVDPVGLGRVDDGTRHTRSDVCPVCDDESCRFRLR